MRVTSEVLIRLKRQFVCALAHDIKTPLNVILGLAELLAGDYCNQPDLTEKLSSITCILKNIEDIVKLITYFLAVSTSGNIDVRFREKFGPAECSPQT